MKKLLIISLAFLSLSMVYTYTAFAGGYKQHQVNPPCATSTPPVIITPTSTPTTTPPVVTPTSTPSTTPSQMPPTSSGSNSGGSTVVYPRGHGQYVPQPTSIVATTTPSTLRTPAKCTLTTCKG